jgi:hypothetical protein
MREKKPKPKKPKGYAKLSQRQKFLAAAKAAEADDTGETFERAMQMLAPAKRGVVVAKAKAT